METRRDLTEIGPLKDEGVDGQMSFDFMFEKEAL